MFSKTRRKKSTDYRDITPDEREFHGEEPIINTSKNKQQQQDHTSIHREVPVGSEKSTVYVSQLFREADLPDVAQWDSIEQLKFLLKERAHMLNQMELVRTQYEKQYALLKRRLDESETENEQLTVQNRSSSKELLLYRNLVEASHNPNSPRNSPDYQQLKSTIDQVLDENQCLYAELNHFKTSDPVYEQVQLLEKSNQRLKQELYQTMHENKQLKKSVHLDEIQHLKLRLSKTLEECEQLRLMNKRLNHQQTPSPKQGRLSASPSSPPLSNQPPSTPISHRSSRSSLNDYSPHEVNELREHVQHLEQTLHKRDNELQKLQTEIEKGTTSIMSSIEDLFIVSSNVSPIQSQPSIEELQNQLDQLHDKLDELTRENQTLKNRTQEFDTIYEENEYLYAEKSQWNEEHERSRIRQLVLEQENHSLREREKELLTTDDSTNHSNLSQLKLKIEWFNYTNNQLELEVARLREQVEMITKKHEQTKRELAEKNQHYKQILEAAQDSQKLPQELARLETLNSDLEIQFENERQEYEKIILALEEQSEQREQKYTSLYETIVKLQNDYRQKELDIIHQMNDLIKQRDNFHTQLTSFQQIYEQLQDENTSLKDEISSKNEINRDLKLALTSSNNDTQSVYNQFHQLSTNHNDSQEKYEQTIGERDAQIEHLRVEQKQLSTKYDAELFQLHQTLIQLQHENNQYASQVERYQLNINKLQAEIAEKQNFIEQIQNDLTDRSALHVSINNQLTQENKVKMIKITELEQALADEQQHKNELQRMIQDLKNELLQSRTIAKESLEKSEEFERHFHETDKHFVHLNEATEPTRRELNTLRTELIVKSDQNTIFQNTIEDEKLRRQRLEMKLRRLKDEYMNVRKELYNRVEDYNRLQHELIEYRFKADYYAQMYNQAFQSNENQSSTAVQLYLKEKADNQHYQVKCASYQQKIEHLQKNYETIKAKYKQRIHEERDLFERMKIKYLDHIKNVQKDLNETRKLLEKDSEFKQNQEVAYQQLVDERRQLLTSMVDKDAKVREMHRENLLLTSKIQLLENQMENLNNRMDRTIRERSLLRREFDGVRLDSNVSIGTNILSSSVSPSSRRIIIDSTGWTQQPVYYIESYGDREYETFLVS